MLDRRLLVEVLAMVMIGDGLLGVLFPRRYAMLWRVGPRAYRELMDEAAAHPNVTRMIGGLEAGLGLWLAARQLPPEPRSSLPPT